MRRPRISTISNCSFFLDFFRCTSEESHFLRVDMDGKARNVNVEVSDCVFTSLDPPTDCYSKVSAVTVLTRCRARDNYVTFRRSNFTNMVAIHGSAMQVSQIEQRKD